MFDIQLLDEEDLKHNEELYTWFHELEESEQERTIMRLEEHFKGRVTKSRIKKLFAKKRDHSEADNYINGMRSGEYFERGGCIYSDGKMILSRVIHPMMIIKDDEYRVQLNDGSIWHLETISKSSDITSLSSAGYPITSENSRDVVRFFSRVMHLNALPEVQGVSRFGWLSDGRFMPYGTDVVYSNNDSAGEAVFKALEPAGKLQDWKGAVIPYLKESEAMRMAFLGSIAAPLVKLVGIDSFFVHLWGFSGGGKTLAGLCAMSFWGNPERLKMTLKGTQTGVEMRASMHNNIPLMLDETQTLDPIKYSALIYEMCSNEGKARATRRLTIRQPKSWATCFLSTGENPLISIDAETGTKNRVVEVKVTQDIFPREVANAVANTVKANYGHMARSWVEYIHVNREGVLRAFNGWQAQLRGMMLGVSNKQVLIYACLCTAHEIFESCFGVDIGDSVGIAAYAKVDIDKCFYNYECMISLCQSNRAAFDPSFRAACWGEMQPGIIKLYWTTFCELCEKLHQDPLTMEEYMLSAGIIERKRYSVRIHRQVTKGMLIKILNNNEDLVEEAQFAQNIGTL